MTWNDIFKVAFTVIGGFGGIGLIIGAIIKFSANRIADRLHVKYQLTLDKNLEQYKQQLEKKNYVSKVRFDAEFSIYRELSGYCHNMINSVYFIYPPFANVPADKEDRKQYEEKVYKEASNALSSFLECLGKNGPFIPKDKYDKYLELFLLCQQNMDVFEQRWNKGYLGIWETSNDKLNEEREAYKRTGEFTEKHNALTCEIRSYLEKLDVIE